jgi:putative addiction module component (TIGR02574 family)
VDTPKLKGTTVMSNYESILAEATHRSVLDRIQLIEAIWDSVPDGKIPPLDQEWPSEIEKRSAEFDSGQAITVTWSEIKASALDRLGKRGA